MIVTKAEDQAVTYRNKVELFSVRVIRLRFGDYKTGDVMRSL